MKNRGFSLISVLVAAGIGIFIFSVIASQIVSSTRQVHYIDAKMETINLKQELALLLLNTTSCNGSFAGKTLTITSSSTGDDTDLTSTLTGPLQALVNNYAANNRYISVTKVNLFRPPLKLDGVTPNTATPYEIKLSMIATEKGTSGKTMNVDGPLITLNVTGTTVDVTACNAGVPWPPGGYYLMQNGPCPVGFTAETMSGQWGTHHHDQCNGYPGAGSSTCNVQPGGPPRIQTMLLRFCCKL